MDRTFIGKVMLWYIIFEEPGLIAATTADKLDIDGVEEGAPALQTRINTRGHLSFESRIWALTKYA